MLDRMQLAGVYAGCRFVVALLVMATYPLTEARFQETVEAIQTRRAQRRRADTGEPDEFPVSPTTAQHVKPPRPGSPTPTTDWKRTA